MPIWAKVFDAVVGLLMVILGFNLGIGSEKLKYCTEDAKSKAAKQESIRRQCESLRQTVELYVASGAHGTGPFEPYRKIEEEFLLPELRSDPKVEAARIQFHCEAHYLVHDKRLDIRQCSDRRGDLRKAGDQLKDAVAAYAAQNKATEAELRDTCIRGRLPILRYICPACL